MEQLQYPRFTPEMKKTHKILIPNMAPVQFRILAAVMEQAGYTCELLENCGSQVSELGLKYGYNSKFGPIEATFSYSDNTKKLLFHLGVGYYF